MKPGDPESRQERPARRHHDSHTEHSDFDPSDEMTLEPFAEVRAIQRRIKIQNANLFVQQDIQPADTLAGGGGKEADSFEFGGAIHGSLGARDSFRTAFRQRRERVAD